MLYTFFSIFLGFTFYEIKKYLLTEKTISVFLLFYYNYLIINSYLVLFLFFFTSSYYLGYWII